MAGFSETIQPTYMCILLPCFALDVTHGEFVLTQSIKVNMSATFERGCRVKYLKFHDPYFVVIQLIVHVYLDADKLCYTLILKGLANSC